ncbi:hypothetical protein [Desulfitobacterium metallireducens]|uniref:Flagellar hook-length control protein-like C-terminal domain-containing protein n=1 Tax=Desulfitobacterium metallireducens DSM 15288 TaxID=871968 RepID=W0EH32_9FIRM|nr:hypothetical protein [Desulfitobacterium metallireducens]AHF08524.1 hypothetical protein DESME_06770 [Desulfitobacterium metallireducens DSM 15288]
MNIQSLNIANNLLNFNNNELREGQRFFIEVLRVDPSGQGVINIKGNLLNALLETTAQPGDKFWAVVKTVGTQELVLAREIKTSGSSGDILLSTAQGSLKGSQVLAGFAGLSPELAKALNTAKNIQWNTLLNGNIGMSQEQLTQQAGEVGLTPQAAQTPQIALQHPLEAHLVKPASSLVEPSFSNVTEKLLSIFPQWAELNGDNGLEHIRDFLNKLGVGYERKLAELLLAKNKPPEEEIAKLKDMIKAQLLLESKDQDDSSTNSKIQGLLEKITGQQLFLGDISNSYAWLILPLKEEQGFQEAKIALQGDRQKKGLDQTHCRIGVYLETLALGKIGVDAYLAENTLNMRILSTNPQEISEFIQEVKEETIARFAHLGLRLTGIDVTSWESNSEFKSFVSGEPRQGVDIYA